MPQEKRLICSHCGRRIAAGKEDFCESCDGDFHVRCLVKYYDRGQWVMSFCRCCETK